MLIPCPLLQSILIPLIAAVVIAVAGKRLKEIVGWISCASLIYSTIMLILVGVKIWTGLIPIYEEYTWSELAKLRFGLLADGLSLPVALTVNLICATCAAYSIPYIRHRIELIYGGDDWGLYRFYFTLYTFFAIGFTGISLSTNLIEMYLFIELVLIPFYFLMDLFGYVDRHRIAIMCFIWSHVSAVLFLIGVVLAYVKIGSFEVSALSSLMGADAFLVCFFILIGLLVKMAVFGFHVWVPWVHAEHPTCIAAILATIVGLGNYIIVRLLVQHMLATFRIFSIPLMIWALITMIYGAFLTLAQDDVKRLCACSTISQNAYSLLGIASCTTLGVVGGVFYFISHIIGKCVLFSIAGILVYQTGLRDMRRMGGLAGKMPLTAALFVIGAMILSAIPPLSGFQAEWIMFVGIFRQGFHGSITGLLIALIGIFATFLTLIYTFWPIKRIFFGPLPDDLRNVERAPYIMTIPLLILAIISLMLGIYPDILMRFLNSAISTA